MSTEKELRRYSVSHTIVSFLLRLFYWIKFEGQENIPEGAAIVCGNHSSWVDPFLIAIAFDRHDILHMMAKIELFKNKIVAFFLKTFGAFSVDRENNDVNSIKTAIRYLKGNEKVGIFPEGTRAAHDGDVEAKKGAIKLAEMTKRPIVPVFIPRDKKIFKPFRLIIGEPYYVPKTRDRSEEHYSEACAELMRRITDLNEDKH